MNPGEHDNLVFCVITGVPTLPRDGNLYDSFVSVDPSSGICYAGELQDGWTVLGHVKAQCFERGELLVLDAEWGREVTGKGRKPSKWWVDYEVYSRFEDALARARAVHEAASSYPPAANPPRTVELVKEQVGVVREGECRLMAAQIDHLTPEQIAQKFPFLKELREALKKTVEGVEGE